MEINSEPLFVGKDVTEILGYKLARKAIQDHVDVDDVLKWNVTDSLGKEQETTLINESGLYSLILSSKLPKAEFKRWVTSEVFPTIRKRRAYMTQETIEQAILNPDTIIKIATALKNEKNRNKEWQLINPELIANNNIMKPKADYFDELVDRNLLTNIRETAKKLNIKENLLLFCSNINMCIVIKKVS